ncbi:MAG: hypothetical protein ACTHNW_06545 [Mucilaginibacter sp.]
MNVRCQSELVEDVCVRPLPACIVRYLSLQPLIAAEATSFLLIEKKQKIKPEKTFRPQAKRLGPVFRQAFARIVKFVTIRWVWWRTAYSFTGTATKPMLRLLSLLFLIILYTARHNIGIMVFYLMFV